MASIDRRAALEPVHMAGKRDVLASSLSGTMIHLCRDGRHTTITDANRSGREGTVPPRDVAATTGIPSQRALLRLVLGAPALAMLSACGSTLSVPAASTSGAAAASIPLNPSPALAVASTLGAVYITPVTAWKIESDTVETVAFSPDGARLGCPRLR